MQPKRNPRFRFAVEPHPGEEGGSEAAKHAASDVAETVAETAPGVTVEDEKPTTVRDDEAHKRIDTLEEKITEILAGAKADVEEMTDGDSEIHKPTGRPWTHALGGRQ